MSRGKVSVSVDVWGDFACFTQSDAKVERVTYKIPTPSACRGILEAIYAKPAEFKYQITGIDVFNPIETISIKKNEVTKNSSRRQQNAKKYNLSKKRLLQDICRYVDQT